MILKESMSKNGFIHLHNGDMYMLDNVEKGGLMKIYCHCGSIVDIDRSVSRTKVMLGKQVECVKCRNVRISKEIDLMNEHFEPKSEEELSF